MIRLQPMIVGVFNFMEEWRDIPNAYGYQVSNYGNVISYKKIKPVALKTMIDKHGYYIVSITFDCIGAKKVYIHQLVAMAFLNHVRTGSTSGNVIDHIDNDKLNNNLNNLQIVSNRYNSTKDVKNKTSKYVGVYYNKKSKLYQTTITIKGLGIYLGRDKCEYKCALMYRIALDNVDKYTDKESFVAMVKQIYLNNYVW